MLLPSPLMAQGGSRTGNTLTWVDIKAGAKRGELARPPSPSISSSRPEPAGTGLRDGIRPYAGCILATPAAAKRTDETKRANERTREESAKGSARVSPPRERERERERC